MAADCTTTSVPRLSVIRRSAARALAATSSRAAISSILTALTVLIVGCRELYSAGACIGPRSPSPGVHSRGCRRCRAGSPGTASLHRPLGTDLGQSAAAGVRPVLVRDGGPGHADRHDAGDRTR